MFAFGIVMRLAYEYFVRYRGNEWAQILFSMALPYMVQIVSRGYFVQIATETISFSGR